MTTVDIDNTDIDRAVVKLVAAGVTYDEAARTLNVSRSTIARRMAEPGAKEAVEDMREATIDHVVRDLTTAAPTAIHVLARACVDPAEPTPVRVRAAEAILNQLAKWRDPSEPVAPPRMTDQEARALLVARLIKLRDEHLASREGS
jgi:hypothetical protein